jgi:hypothetical protein
MDPIQGQQNFFGAPPPAEMPPPTAPPTAVPMSPEAAGPQRAAVPTWGDNASPASAYEGPGAPAPYEQPEPEPTPAEPDYRTQIANLEKRLADTQRNYHQQVDTSRLGQEIVNGLAHAAEQRRQRDYAAASYQPPTVEDPDALLTDPQALLETMGRYGDYVYRRAVSDMAPHMAGVAGMSAIAPTIIMNQMEIVAERAQASAAREGIPQAEFEQLLPMAEQIIQAGNIPQEEKLRLRLRPEAVLAAVKMARDSRGPRTAAPPSLGPGGGPAPVRQQSAGDIRKVEQMLGIKFDKEDHVLLKQRLAAQGVR